MDSALLVAVRLAREGYGSAAEILQQPTDLVLAQLEYCAFTSEYEKAQLQMSSKS